MHQFKLSKSFTKCFKRSFSGVRCAIEDEYGSSECITRLGKDVLHYPLINRSNGFTTEERERFRLTGLLPPAKFSLQEQTRLYLNEFRTGDTYDTFINPDASMVQGGIDFEKIRKFLFLQSIQNQNETLFYKLLIDKFEEMAPIVYTPTVGWFCKNFSRVFKRPTGLFVTLLDKGRVPILLSNVNQEQVDAIVITDGSKIRGLGDQGIGGMGISIGKLNLYVAGGGFNPKKTLPVQIDIGTNNPELLSDPFYLGLKIPRVQDDVYYALMDEFIACAVKKWPNVLIQFEDIEFRKAFKLLQRYRKEFLIFNDDIQGTGAIVLAGLLGAMKVQNKPSQMLTEQVFVIVGAGGSGRGVMHALKNFLMRYGLSEDEAVSKFYVLDREGLIAKRPGLDPFIEKFARKESEFNKLKLLDVIRLFKPTVLIGVSGSGGIFTEDVLKAMKTPKEGHLPIIFPLSSPASRSECTAEEAFTHTDGQAIFASGVPFSDVSINGVLYKANVMNNAYIYPGVSFGSFIGRTKTISDNMILAAAETLSDMLTEESAQKKEIFPELQNIREISANVAAHVIKQAHTEGHMNNAELGPILARSFDEMREYVRLKQWSPSYEVTPV